MKTYVCRSFLLLLSFFALLGVGAQSSDDAGQRRGTASAVRRSPAQIRSAVAQKLGADRATRLRSVIEREAVSVLTDSLGGFAIVGYNLDFPAVLGYGDGCIDASNPSPEFLYLLDLYEKALTTPEEQVQSVRAKAPARASAINVNITPMLNTTWAQRSPYNLRTPVSGSKHTLTGCVATAFAQVFKYYERPRKMHGYRRYHFNNSSNQREFCDYDYSAVSFDWGNMPKKLKDDGFLGIGNTSSTQNQAVAELMYAAGVLSSMNYGLDGSGANTAAATACIDAACEDLTAYYTQYDSELVMAELREGRPVVYAGSNDKSEGHCFVIDGCRSDGYLHCNLGWDGTDDGYYLPSDMKGYSFYQNIAIVQPTDEAEPLTPLPEMAGRTVRANRTAATELEANRWYVLWNSGRSASPASSGVNTKLNNVGTIPAGETTEICGGQLVRFLPNDDGTYYIQTALGDYWYTVIQNTSYKTTDAPRQKFNIGTISPGYFYMKCGSTTVDSDGLGGNVVGWGSSTPTDIYSNASWQIFPVELGYSPNVVPVFDDSQTYVIKNVGYSQGYLVATDEEDHPTLRGVTTDHSNGLYDGAAYHDAPDFSSLNSFWYVKSSGGKFYLVNAGKNQSLTNSGDKSVYTFSDDLKPINITVGADGFYRINSGTHAESYLCAATHLPNPAAFWTIDDDGSKWTIEPMDVIEQNTIVKSLTDDVVYTLRNVGSNGYSMGYLVALAEGDAQPTLRGVVQEHSRGCNDSYKNSPDFDHPGSYWQILTDGYKQYLYNCGTKKFLTNSGNGTSYRFTDEATPINITLGDDGKFRFNAGTDNQSYLCAATHLDTPAAFWTADDEGSKWVIAEAEDAPVAPTTYYAFKGGTSGTGATVKSVVDAVTLRRLDLVDLVVRGALRRQKQ